MTLRVPTVEDAEAITAFLNEHALAVYGESDLELADVEHWFTFDNLWIRVREAGATIVGYGDVASDGADPDTWSMDVRALDEGTATELIAAAEAHALAHATARPVKLRGFVSATDPAGLAAFAACGFGPIRTSFSMRAELPDELPAPEWPPGIAVRTLREGEEQRVYEAHQESFEDHWDFHRQPKEEWRRYTTDAPQFDPSLWFVAEERDEIAGVALCTWRATGDPGRDHEGARLPADRLGWVNILGVRRPWRRRGLGLALLLHAFAEFKRRGAARVGLGVDAENTTGAVRLYERAGMHVARLHHTYERIVE